MYFQYKIEKNDVCTFCLPISTHAESRFICHGYIAEAVTARNFRHCRLHNIAGSPGSVPAQPMAEETTHDKAAAAVDQATVTAYCLLLFCVCHIRRSSNVVSMLGHVCDAVPAFKQHCINVLCSLDSIWRVKRKQQCLFQKWAFTTDHPRRAVLYLQCQRQQ